MTFPADPPAFRTLKIYTATVEDLELYSWQDGAWVKIGEARGNQQPVITLTFDHAISSEKLKLVFTKTLPNTRAEVYELEMYK